MDIIFELLVTMKLLFSREEDKINEFGRQYYVSSTDRRKERNWGRSSPRGVICRGSFRSEPTVSGSCRGGSVRVSGAQDGETAHESVINGHQRTRVVELTAVIGRTEHCD